MATLLLGRRWNCAGRALRLFATAPRTTLAVAIMHLRIMAKDSAHHDVGVAIRKTSTGKLIERVLVVDVDVHQGNGTAAIFANDESVFTSIHRSWYPHCCRRRISMFTLKMGSGMKSIAASRSSHRSSGHRFDAQLLMYVAGADPYGEDQLGGLAPTIEGPMERDRLVFGIARHRNLPVCVTLAAAMRTWKIP
jgi:acetoin utilization deacetylase AcuC-like enzyme